MGQVVFKPLRKSHGTPALHEAFNLEFRDRFAGFIDALDSKRDNVDVGSIGFGSGNHDDLPLRAVINRPPERAPPLETS